MIKEVLSVETARVLSTLVIPYVHGEYNCSEHQLLRYGSHLKYEDVVSHIRTELCKRDCVFGGVDFSV